MYIITSKEYMGVTYSDLIRLNADGSITSFPPDQANTDYQAYLFWLAEGNTPEPADNAP